MAKQQLTTASVLAFERKIDPSDAIMASGNWENRKNASAWKPIVVAEKSVRGTISNRLKAKDTDPAKLDAAIQSPNLQRVDVAALPSDADTLKASFTLRVLSGTGTPSACNSVEYRSKLLATIEAYKRKLGFSELSRRYAQNIANGRFLWRNRLVSEEVEVEVRHVRKGKVEREWFFTAFDFNLRDFNGNEAVQQLAEVIKGGLEDGIPVLLEVVAFARMGKGQEVYPSQELILEKGDKKGQKSKTLYVVSGAAGIHSQKIGNALRTIDTWYPESAEIGPIAVEPYGSVTSQGKAFRAPKEKNDFYTLLDGWVLSDRVPPDEQQHFVIANLVRGGVFGEAEKD